MNNNLAACIFVCLFCAVLLICAQLRLQGEIQNTLKQINTTLSTELEDVSSLDFEENTELEVINETL